MAKAVLVDAGFLVSILSRRDEHHGWSVAIAQRHPPPWITCEAALSEAFHLLQPRGTPELVAILRRRAVRSAFSLPEDQERILSLLEKYADVPMGLADACLVRMTERMADPVLLTTDADFRFYRRHSRQAIPCELPD